MTEKKGILIAEAISKKQLGRMERVLGRGEERREGDKFQSRTTFLGTGEKVEPSLDMLVQQICLEIMEDEPCALYAEYPFCHPKKGWIVKRRRYQYKPFDAAFSMEEVEL